MKAFEIQTAIHNTEGELRAAKAALNSAKAAMADYWSKTYQKAREWLSENDTTWQACQKGIELCIPIDKELSTFYGKWVLSGFSSRDPDPSWDYIETNPELKPLLLPLVKCAREQTSVFNRKQTELADQWVKNNPGDLDERKAAVQTAEERVCELKAQLASQLASLEAAPDLIMPYEKILELTAHLRDEADPGEGEAEHFGVTSDGTIVLPFTISVDSSVYGSVDDEGYSEVDLETDAMHIVEEFDEALPKYLDKAYDGDVDMTLEEPDWDEYGPFTTMHLVVNIRKKEA